MSDKSPPPPTYSLPRDSHSPSIDKKVKNFSARLKSRAKAEAAAKSAVAASENMIPPAYRPDSSASTVRPDSVLSFRSEIPTVKQYDFNAFRPESASILPPEAVTTVRPDSAAAIHGQGQGVFRPFQPPSGPTARFNLQYQASTGGAGDADWEARDEMRQRELEEMRARATQMEKTMRWWSDCTANWREKWSKVRNERNKSRDDCRQLRSKLEIVVKECTNLKREKHDLTADIDKLRAEVEMLSIKDPDKDSDSMSSSSNISMRSQPDTTDAVEEDTNVMSPTSSSVHKSSATIAEAKLSELVKMYNAEKEEKEGLRCKVDELTSELTQVQCQLDETSKAKTLVQKTLDTLNSQSEEAVTDSSRRQLSESSDMSDQLEVVRSQLEGLQVANASEWAKSERLSSEKSLLERENKQLKALVTDLQEEALKRHAGASSTTPESSARQIQEQLDSRNKEFIELKRQHQRTKKLLQESSTELGHSKRRSEQYENEVKKLRSRIEELKDDLIKAENDLDTQVNLVRKLQRTCENLQETNENYQAHNSHLQSRLRNYEIAAPADALLAQPFAAPDVFSSDDDDDNVDGENGDSHQTI